MEKKKVLVVDDEENVRLLVQNILGKENVVLEANDGEAAVQMARSYHPDFILMDIMMPKMDGYTACYAIKQDALTRAIPVVMAAGTTILGMAPLLPDPMFGAMAVTIMGGLFVATMLTIIVLPAFYAAMYKLKKD